ncbi:MAG: hypothetical protein Kow0088_25190 [Anaerolineales bacterium]
MSLWKWLRPMGSRLTPPPGVVIADPEMRRVLEELAEQEGRSAQQIATDLLRYALSARYAAQEYFRRWQRLSRREQQVVALLCLGYTYREIADQLIISYDTVKTHARNALNKFELRNLSEMRQALADWDFSAWQPGSTLSQMEVKQQI